MLLIENTDRFSADLEKSYDQTNDSLRSLSDTTMSYAKKVLSD